LNDPQQLNLYSYTRNNPLKYIDPIGLDITVTGSEQEEYLRRFNARKGVKFQTAIVNNKLTIVNSKGEALNDKQLKELSKTLKGGEAELFKAITDDKNHATVDTGNGKPNDNVLFGQATAKGLNTLDFTDIRQLDAASNAGGNTGSMVVAHETLEAYYTSLGLPPFGNPSAHNNTGLYFSGYDYASTVEYMKPDANGNVRGFTLDSTLTN
jgi:hypothetical protein